MYKVRKALRTTLLGVVGGGLALVLSGCAGAGAGSGAGGGTPVAVSGAMTTGSIIVGGIHFDDADVNVRAEDDSHGAGFLADGMTIKLLGSVDETGSRGTATTVEVENELRGPVTALDAVARTFEVLGFTVAVTTETHFDDFSPGSFDGVNVGDVVEVYGFKNAEGRIRATRLELYSGDDPVEVRGRINTVGTGSFTIEGSDVAFGFDGTTEVEYGDTFAAGDLVEAKLESGGSGGWRAVEIELEDAEDEEYRIDDDVEIEGYISGFTAGSDTFFVGTTAVRISDETEIDDERMLADGLLIEAEGEYAGSVLVVEEIYFEDQIVIVAPADADDSADVLGLDVAVTGVTSFHGTISAIDEVVAGNGLAVSAFMNGDGSLTALNVVGLDYDIEDEVEVEGPVTVASDSELSIAGVSVTVPTTGVAFSDDEGAPMTRSAFLAALSDHMEVEAEGTFSGGILTPEELELD